MTSREKKFGKEARIVLYSLCSIRMISTHQPFLPFRATVYVSFSLSVHIRKWFWRGIDLINKKVIFQTLKSNLQMIPFRKTIHQLFGSLDSKI